MMGEFATDLEILIPVTTLSLYCPLPKFGFHPSCSLPLLVSQSRCKMFQVGLPLERQNIGGNIIRETDTDGRTDQQAEFGKQLRLLPAEILLRQTRIVGTIENPAVSQPHGHLATGQRPVAPERHLDLVAQRLQAGI